MDGSVVDTLDSRRTCVKDADVFGPAGRQGGSAGGTRAGRPAVPTPSAPEDR